MRAYTHLTLKIAVEHSREIRAVRILPPVQAIMFDGFAGAPALDDLLAKEIANRQHADHICEAFLTTGTVPMPASHAGR